MNAFQLHLQVLHLPLLIIECVLKLTKFLCLHLPRSFHFLIDLYFSLHKFVIFSLQVFEPVLKILNIIKLPLFLALACTLTTCIDTTRGSLASLLLDN